MWEAEARLQRAYDELARDGEDVLDLWTLSEELLRAREAREAWEARAAREAEQARAEARARETPKERAAREAKEAREERETREREIERADQERRRLKRERDEQVDRARAEHHWQMRGSLQRMDRAVVAAREQAAVAREQEGRDIRAVLEDKMKKEKDEVREAGYGREIGWWEGCVPDKTDKDVMIQLGKLVGEVVGQEAEGHQGYYIGSTQNVVRRWRGWYDDDGRWVEGHRNKWTGESRAARMVVLAVRSGKQGGQLEDKALDVWQGKKKNLNISRRAVGTANCERAVNYLYFIYW